MEVADMLSALRSTLEDPSGAATTSGAAQEPSAPVMPQLLPAGAFVVSSSSTLGVDRLLWALGQMEIE